MNCETLQDYLDRYGPLVAERARQAFEPLHVPTTDAVVTLDLKRPMLPAQAHVVTAAVKTLKRQKSVYLCSECGTGKTQMGACAVHAHAAGRPYRAIVMAPPHLVTTWQKRTARRYSPTTRSKSACWKAGVNCSPTRARKPATAFWLHHRRDPGKKRTLLAGGRREGPPWLLRCPDCGSQLRSKAGGEGDYLTMKDLERSRKKCIAEVPTRIEAADGQPVMRRCGTALWQYIDKRAVWAPADYIHKHMRGVFDYLICDEVHEEKSETSARANALGALVASCRKVIAMTGTLIGGKAGHVRSLLFRMSPQSLKAEGLSWQDDMEFARRYGRVDTIITEKVTASDNRRSNGKSTSRRQAEQPGIMPTLYGRHLIGNTIFLNLKDVAEGLPEYAEQPIAVRMGADLMEPYKDLEATLKDEVAKLLKRGNHQLLSGMLHALLAWPDVPYDWPAIGYNDNGRFVHVVTPPSLDRNTLWPKERKLLEILTAERSQGRQCWVFCVYTSTHPVLQRLEKIVTDAGFTVKVLDAAKVPTRHRSQWIADNAPGVDVLISHPQPVRTGLTLFDAADRHNFPSHRILRNRV